MILWILALQHLMMLILRWVGAVACRNDGGSEELAASDPRSTLGQIDNSSLCEADVPPSAW